MAKLKTYKELMELREQEKQQITGSGQSASGRRLKTYEELKQQRMEQEAPRVGQEILNRVNAWLKNSDTYAEDHNWRYKGRKGTYEDPYVADSGEYLERVTSQKKDFDAEYAGIMKLLGQYGKYYDSAWVDSVRSALNGSREQQDKIIKAAESDRDYWGQFAPTQEALEQGFTAEQVYGDWAKDQGYRAKYNGISYDGLKKLLGELEDGEEKEWLDSFIRGTPENRQRIYADNQARIEELEGFYDEAFAVEPWYNSYKMNPGVWDEETVSRNMALYDKLRSDFGTLSDLEAEIERLKKENTNYKRGNYNEDGQYYGSKVVDYYHLRYAALPDFIPVSSRRDIMNPSREELDEYDAMMDSTTWDFDENGVYRDAFGNELVADSSGTWTNPKAQEHAAKDRLGIFLSASEKDLEEVAGTIVDGTWGRIIADGVDGGWEQLTKDEINIYYYILNSEGQETADQYLTDMKTELNRRQAADQSQRIATAYQEANFLGKVGLNAATFPAQLFSSVTGFLENTANTLRGDEINPYSSAHAGTHFSQTVRSETAAELDKTRFKIPVIDFTLGDIYQSGMSILDSFAAIGIGGQLGGVLLASGAASSEAQRLYEQGASMEQIGWGSAAAGAAEMIFESISIDKLIDIDDAFTKRQIIRNLLVQGGIEASEEGFTEIANILANSVIMGSQSDWNKLVDEHNGDQWMAFLSKVQDVAKASFSGLLSGVGSATIPSVASYAEKNAEQQRQYTEDGREIMAAEGGVEALKGFSADVGSALAPDVQKQLNKLSGKVKGETAGGNGIIGKAVAKAKNASNARKVGKLLHTTIDAVNAQSEAQLAESMVSHGMKQATAQKLSGIIVKSINGTELTETQVDILESLAKDERVVAAMKDTFENQESTAYQLGQKVADFEEMVESGRPQVAPTDSQEGVTEQRSPSLPDGQMEREGQDPPLQEEAELASAEGQVVRDTEKGAVAVQVADVASAGNGKMVMNLADGSTADVSELSFPDPGEQELYETVAKVAGNAAEAQQLLDSYREGNASAKVFARGIREAFEYGKLQYSPEETATKSIYARRLAPSLREAAYNMGKKAGENATAQRQREASDRNTGRMRKGGVHYGYDGQKVDKSKLSSAQRVGVDFAERLARRKGMTFYFYRSLVNDQGMRVYTDKDGNIVEADNGFYDPSDGSIHIDLNSGNMGDAVLFTIAHELTHFIQDWSPYRYRTLCRILIDGYTEQGQGMDELVRNKQEEYRKKGKELTYEEAYDEVIASSMESVLNDGRVIDLLDELETRDKGLVEQIRSFLEDVAQLLHEIIQTYKGKKPTSPEGRIVQRMTGIYEQLQQVFAEGLHEGGENYREGGKENTTQNGGVRYNVRQNLVDVNGKVYAKVIKPGHTDYNRTKHSNKAYKTTLYNKIFQRKTTIYNVEGSKMVVEFAGAKERVNNHPVLGEFTETADRLKRIALFNHQELLKNSVEDTPNSPDGHKWADAQGWKRRRSYMLDLDKIYPVYFHISTTEDGRNILYDITVDKNEGVDLDPKPISHDDQTVRATADRDSPQLAVKDLTPSGDKVSQDVPGVKKNSVRYQVNQAAQEHLRQQNAGMGEDVADLNDLVAAQRKRGGGMKGTALYAAAGHLMKTAGVKGDKYELARLLQEYYRYIGQSTALTWDSLRLQAQPVVDWLMEHTVRSKQISEYARDILDHLRGCRIYLDDTQKGEAAHLYGSFGAFRNMLMGTVTVANENSISLDSLWQELASLYPDVFDADMNAADMPEALLEAVHRLRNTDTSELEYEYNRDFIESELLSRVYDSYWNASTLYSVADHYEGQIKSLKAKHKQRMSEVYMRHRNAENSMRADFKRRQEAIQSHQEERYQRREAEYRESRQRAVERHDRSQMRQKIRRAVESLRSLTEKAPRDRRAKEELQEFARSALKAADMVFLENYNEYDMVRNGVGTSLRGNEPQLLEECRQLLEQLDKAREAQEGREPAESSIHDKWDPERALQKDAQMESIKRELSKKMGILREAGVFKAEFDRLNQFDAKALIQDLMDSYQKLKGLDVSYLQGAYKEEVYNRIAQVREEIGAKALRDMSKQELEQIYQLYHMVTHVIRTANETFAGERKESIDKLGGSVVRQMEDRKRQRISRKAIESLKKTGWNGLTVPYVFRMIGSDTMTQLYKNLRRGEDVWARDVKEAKDFWQKQAKRFGADAWNMDQRMTLADSRGHEFSVSLGQLMSLYALSRRQQALEHLKVGGFMLDTSENYVENILDKAFPKVYTAADRFLLDQKGLEAVCSKLTKEQRAFVEATQGYLSGDLANKGNEVSMALYGLKLFKEQNYFPLRTAGHDRYESTELIDQNKLKNSGFTKETKPKAGNAVILSDYSHVWTGHVNQMGLYHGMTLPMEDMDRVLNYGRGVKRDENGNILKDDQGNDIYEYADDSVSITLQNIFGKHPENYIRDLMKQLNGGLRADELESLPNRMLGRFKKSAVAASLSVWIQQWTSIFRAMAHIALKYFFQPPLTRKYRAEQMANMKEHCPIAIIKEMGGFDTGMGSSVHDFITMKETQGMKDYGKEFLKHPLKKFDEITSWLPAHADESTWVRIWVAAKRETAAKHPQLKQGSEAFYKAAAERFNEVITLTQVYDSVMAKSAYMRSKGFGAKMVTQFMSEPTVALNMAIDACAQHARTGKVQIGTAAALLTSILVNSACSALIYAMRDDDEEETFAEKYGESFLSNLIDGVNPLTYIPIVRDVWSIFQGYDVGRSDMELWSGLASALEKVVKVYMKDDATEKEMAEAWWTVGDYVFSVAGIPEKNIRREIKAVQNVFLTLQKDFDGRATTSLSTADTLQEAFLSSVPILNWIKGETKAEKLLDALAAGDTQYAQRLRSTYKTESACNNALAKAVREQFDDGEITESEAARMLEKYAGKDKTEAREKISYWKFQKENPDSDLEEGSAVKWYLNAKPAGISLKIYTEYKNRIKNLQADKDKDGKTISGSKKEKVLAVINSLPLTRKQKDVLYLDNGSYSEEDLDETPWH